MAAVLISCTNRSASSTAASSGRNTFTATVRLCLRSSARWGPKIRTDARYREKPSVLPGGLKPGLGPLRGRVLKDMAWKWSCKTSRAGFPRGRARVSTHRARRQLKIRAAGDPPLQPATGNQFQESGHRGLCLPCPTTHSEAAILPTGNREEPSKQGARPARHRGGCEPAAGGRQGSHRDRGGVPLRPSRRERKRL